MTERQNKCSNCDYILKPLEIDFLGYCPMCGFILDKSIVPKSVLRSCMELDNEQWQELKKLMLGIKK